MISLMYRNMISRIRPPVNISIETKCYTKKLFTKKRSGPKRKEIKEEMFLLQNNPDMCIENYGRMLGKLNKLGDLNETNYDWEIHAHGDLVEYIQVKPFFLEEMIVLRFKMEAARADKDQFTQQYTMTLQTLMISASLKKKMKMELTEPSVE